MKPAYSLILVSALVFAVVFGLRSDAVSQTPIGERWEYKIMNPSPLGNIEAQLNRLGDNGWELVTVLPAAERVQERYFLKHRK
jgi:hypothetical protein